MNVAEILRELRLLIGLFPRKYRLVVFLVLVLALMLFAALVVWVFH